MKQDVTKWMFEDTFRSSQYKNNFSYEGLGALFDYLENFEEDTGEEMDFDLVAIASEYTEYKNVEEYVKDFDTDVDKEDYTDDGDFEEEDYNEAVLEEIEEKTSLIKIDDSESFIIQSY